MADPVVPPAGGDPSANPNPPAPPKNEPPAPEPKPKEPIGITSEQLKARLDDSAGAARTALLKELGFKDADAAKAAVKKLAEIEIASLSEKEKLERTISELTPLAQRGSAAIARETARVEAEFKALPEAVQAAIDATANGDADKRREAMAILSAATAAAKSSAPPAPPKPAGPSNNGPPPPPPPGGGQTKFQEWEAMRARHPLMADIFYGNHQREIERTRPASA